MRLVFFIILLCSVSLYSQKMIVKIADVQGVIFENEKYSEKMILELAKDFYVYYIIDIKINIFTM